MNDAGGVRDRRMSPRGATTTTTTTNPSVVVDKLSSLVLVASSDEADKLDKRQRPRCHYQEDYLEEDVQTLYSEWLDGEDDEECTDHATPPTAHASNGNVQRKDGDGSALKKKKKMFRRRLQWRAPGTKAPSKRGVSSGNSPKKNKKTPPLPPSNSASRRTSSTGASHSVSFGRSQSFAGSFRSNASSYLTTKSSTTQKRSNRAATVSKNPKVAQASEGASVFSSYSQVSVKSSTPPLARYRRRRRLDALNKSAQMEKVREANEEDEVPFDEVTKDAVDDLTRDAVDDRDEDERTHVTIDKCRIKVCTNEQARQDELAGPLERGSVYDSSWAPIDEARHLATNLFLGTNGSSSPTSVADSICGMSTPFDEYDGSAVRNLNQTMEGLSMSTELESEQRRSEPGASMENQVFLEQMSRIDDIDDRTVSTVDEPDRRVSGPIDIDTCAPVVTPTERRHLRAMHKLGSTHLRNNEYPQALTVFSEILRGQSERHGRRSEQTAMAMQNLSVVCMKCRRYDDVIKLSDGACRLRVSKFGPEAPGIASCLSMQGVALLETKQYPLALASFKEALRVRAIEQSGTGGKEIEYNGASLPAHPQVVRLLNNIGCSLFELNELESSKETFLAALQMQRELKSTDPLHYNSFEVDPKDAHQRLLGVALTLANLGTIHLRLNELDLSLANYEEAVLVRHWTCYLVCYEDLTAAEAPGECPWRRSQGSHRHTAEYRQGESRTGKSVTKICSINMHIESAHSISLLGKREYICIQFNESEQVRWSAPLCHLPRRKENLFQYGICNSL